MSILKNLSKSILPQQFIENHQLRKWYESQIEQLPSIQKAIGEIEKRWQLKSTEISDKPVFIFASGWRSGSTLLQRLVNSDGRVLLWGEPFANCNLIPDLANSIRALGDRYPSPKDFIDSEHFQEQNQNTNLSQRWTANLNPEVANLVSAHRQFFQTLYGEPAYQKGYQIWGLKEVRLSIDHAIYLQWLFPQAKFLFLYRDPYKAYRSCRTWRNLYLHYPDMGVFNAETFGNHWQTMTAGYLNRHSQVRGKVIKYEELCGGNFPLQELSDYLQLDLQKEVLNQRIGSNKKAEPIPKNELKQLQKAVEPLASKLGYSHSHNGDIH